MLSHLLLVLCIVGFSRSINSSPGFGNGGGDDRKVLIVGEELWKQTIPLQLGSRVYELQGLKSHTWYEVKISYPASVCIFSCSFLLVFFMILILIVSR